MMEAVLNIETNEFHCINYFDTSIFSVHIVMVLENDSNVSGIVLVGDN